jgi:indole-3-glycerol phosphate synthase
MGEHVLDAILEAKKAEIAELARVECAPRGAGAPRTGLVARSVARQNKGPLRLVTEIKRRSPSAGPLSTVMSVEERAVAYGRGGAAMISVLCDARFFDGGWHHVTAARRALHRAGLEVPILAKEFVLDDRQIDEAAASGADAVLLIARIVPPSRLAALFEHASAIGLEPLVEVVSEEEVGAALDAGARLIGVNARDLDTLAMDPERAARVLAAIPSDRVSLHLSGLKSADDVVATIRRRCSRR